MISQIISKLKSEFSRFTFIGIINAALTFVVFFSFLKIFKVDYLLSLSIAWFVGVLFSYTFNFIWVFKPESSLRFRKRFVKYFLATLITFGLNLFLLKIIVENTRIDPFYVQASLMPFIVLINFITSKFWSLRKTAPDFLPENKKSFPVFFKYASIWIITISLTLIAYSMWALNRGFEITDESYYLLLAIHSSAVKVIISGQHWLTSPLWFVTGNIVGFRAIGLIILLLASTILAAGSINAYATIAKADRFKRRDLAVIVASTFSGALLYGSTINFSPCYNLLAAASVYAAVGFAFLVIGKLPGWRVNILYLLSGCMLGIAFLGKFSAGIASLVLISALIAVLRSNKREKILGIALVLLGMVSSLFLIILPHGLNANLIEEFRLGIAVFKQVQVESNVDRLLRYGRELAMQTLWSGVLFIIPLAYLSLYKKSRNIARYVFISLLCIVILNYIYLPIAFKASRWVGATASFSMLLALALIASLTIWTKNIKMVALIIGLIILPYCVAIGTGNGINTQIVDSLASWGVLISILTIVAINKQRGYYPGLMLAICFAFVSLVAVQFAISSFSPYHLKGTLWEQKIPTKIDDIGAVKTDQATHDFVSTLTSASLNCYNGRSRQYLGFYGLPGVALIVDAVPVFSPWLTNANQSEIILSEVNDNVLKSALIGVTLLGDGSLPQLPKQFGDLPNGYQICGEATFPYTGERIQLWKPI